MKVWRGHIQTLFILTFFLSDLYDGHLRRSDFSEPYVDFIYCFLQGDPGGVIGIIPLKGDRGFPGSPGFPVR